MTQILFRFNPDLIHQFYLIVKFTPTGAACLHTEYRACWLYTKANKLSTTPNLDSRFSCLRSFSISCLSWIFSVTRKIRNGGIGAEWWIRCWINGMNVDRFWLEEEERRRRIIGTLIILRLNFSWAVDKVSFLGLNLDFCERRKFLQKLNFVFNITYSIK